MSKQDLIDNVFVFDFDGPDDAEQWGGQYPVIQWSNREKAWEFPLGHWTGTPIEANHELVMIDHGETDEPGFLLQDINISVIAHRSIWETDSPEGKKMYTQKPDFSVARWSKRYNFLVICRETEDLEPAVITVAGYTGEAMFKAVSQGRKRTVNMVKSLTGKQLPGYLFWLSLAAGAKQLVGKEAKSAIYPPACLAHDISDLRKPALIELLKSLYVGDTLRDMYADGLYEQGQQWSVEHIVAANAETNKATGVPQIAAPPVDPVIEVLPSGELYFPDLGNAQKEAWFACALSIPRLFDDRGQVVVSFNNLMKNKGLTGPCSPDQWEAWRTELERLWDENQVPF